jgi:hypothetical protein
MAGLFMTPEEALMAQRAQTSSMTRDQMNNVLRGSLFNLGGGLSRGLTQAFGGDPRSPLEKRQAGVSEIIRRADLTDPQSVRGTIAKLNQEGFTNEAMSLFDLLPAPRKPEKTVVDEWIQTESVGDTTKKFLFQRDNFGFITRVGEVSATAKNPIQGFQLGQEWQRDIQFDDDSRGTFLSRLAGDPAFEGFGPFSDTDPEELGAFTGLIAKVANDLKDSHRRAINDAVFNGQMTRAQAEAAVAPNDDFYLDTAYQRFTQAGGVEANIDRGMNIAGADVKLAPRVNTTDPDTLDARIAQADAKAAAVAQVAERAGKLVVGDPRTGEFRVGGMNPQQVQSVFSRMDQKSDADIRAQLEADGFQFNEELFQSHAVRWQWMREMPSVTAKFINLADNQDLFDAERARLLDQLESANNFPAFAKATEVLKYIDRIKPPRKTRFNPRSGRRN